jgi:methyl-accepting chemotaxis protein
MQDQGSRPYRRRTIYIQKKFQRNFILKFCSIALGAMLLASLLLYYFSSDTLTATYHFRHLALQRTGEAIMPALVITNLVVLLALLASTVVVTLYVSHKIGGPLYRLNKGIQAIGEGDLKGRIRLRENDQLMDFASHINWMVDNLGLRVRQIRSEVAMLKEKAADEGWDRKEMREGLEKLSQKIHQLFEIDE